MSHQETPQFTTSGLHRPAWISSQAGQRCVLVRDGSGSMKGKKAEDAREASEDLVAELALPTNKDGFEVGVIDFSNSARVANDLQKATELDGRVAPLRVRGRTNVTAGLRRALSMVEASPLDPEKSYLRPVVILFTDGCHNKGASPEKVAARLREKADLVTVAFGSDADEVLLTEIATSPQHFYRCKDGTELRAFLAAVGKTMTATMAAGEDPTDALTQVAQ